MRRVGPMNQRKRTPLEMFYYWEATVPDEVFLRQSLGERRWQELTYRGVGQRVRSLASFLLQQKYPAGSRIALLSSNCSDWVVADLAIMMAGYVSVPVHANQDASTGRYILEHSGSKMVLVGEFTQVERVGELIPTDVSTLALNGCTIDTDYCLSGVIDQLEPYAESPIPDLDSMMTILYTSGTSGNPKGVVHNCSSPAEVLPRFLSALGCLLEGERERLFSFLPMSHVAERVAVEMRALYNGSSISFSAGQKYFFDEIRSVQPHFFFAVPRLWVKFKDSVDAKFSPEAQARFGVDERGEVRQMLGLNQAQVILTGSAPCPTDVHQWYLDMGIRLREGYGMTENFCDGCFWLSTDEPVPGKVGKPLPGVDVRVSSDNEICFRSSGLMRGYFRDPAKSTEALRGGWYHTGDRGFFDGDGNLQIIGRIGEAFKTTKGEFISPVELEKRFECLAELDQLCVFGQGKDQPLLLANLSELGGGQSRDDLQNRLSHGLERVNQTLSPHARVAQIFITKQKWTTDAGLMTPSLKIRRKVLEACYSDWIEAHLGVGPIIVQ